MIWEIKLIRIILVILFGFSIHLVIKLIIPFLIQLLLSSIMNLNENKRAAQKRVKTLAKVGEATSILILIIYLILFLFGEFGIDIGPLLVGAGVLSLTVAFGAQSLVKDILAGVFIILENQFNIGDWVQIDAFEGKVIDINFRRTILETPKGAKHIIPNGSITIVTNSTNNQFNVVNLNIPAKVDSNFNKINKIIDQVGKKLAKDKDFAENIIEAPKATGVNEINEYAAVIRVWGKAKPGTQVQIKRELAERIVKEFSKHKIKLPGRIIK
jgi:small conductance mechanosensitive channel